MAEGFTTARSTQILAQNIKSATYIGLYYGNDIAGSWKKDGEEIDISNVLQAGICFSMPFA